MRHSPNISGWKRNFPISSLESLFGKRHHCKNAVVFPSVLNIKWHTWTSGMDCTSSVKVRPFALLPACLPRVELWPRGRCPLWLPLPPVEGNLERIKQGCRFYGFSKGDYREWAWPPQLCKSVYLGIWREYLNCVEELEEPASVRPDGLQLSSCVSCFCANSQVSAIALSSVFSSAEEIGLT